MNIDHGAIALNRTVVQYGKLLLKDANEAETRRKVIDVILSEVLGWLPDDMSYEERVTEDKQTEYADYIIRTATTKIIVEAKRSGAAFTLPNNRKAGALGGFLAAGEIGEAIRQSRDYARVKSAPYAVVTNGSAWIIFPAARIDGVAFEDGQAHIFRDLRDIKDRLVEFWELLSRQRVIEGSLESRFSPQKSVTADHRLINVIRDSAYRTGRNQVYPAIEEAVNIAFTDEAILDDTSALENCYVKNTERVKYDERIKMHIADAKPALQRTAARPRLGKGDAHVLEDALSSTKIKLPQFLLVLGPVGAGKTTFLHYTQKISSLAVKDGKVIWIYIDFKLATKSDRPRSFMYSQLLSFIENDKEFSTGDWDKCVQHAYRDEISALRHGPLALLARSDEIGFNKRVAEMVMADRAGIEQYVEKILRYKSHQIPVYLVIDNVDQFDDEKFCGDIFNESQACTRRLRANIIMTMRDSTYLRHRNTPTFDAFQVDVIYVDPPSVLPVLSRRFAYAKHLLSGQSATFTADGGARFKVEDLAGFFDIISKSVLEDPCGYMIDVLSSGNIRRCLSLVREFLASAHISADRAVYDYALGTPSYIPRHEFFKGAIFGQRRFYREEESQLLNLFDAKLSKSEFQLLRLHILSKLVRCAASAANEGIDVTILTGELYRVGISQAEVFSCLTKMCAHNVIRTVSGLDFSEDATVIATRFGGYLFTELSRDLTYLEACAIDASIHTVDHWERLKELTEAVDSSTGTQRLELRGNRLDIFLEYLEHVEKNWMVACNRYDLNFFEDSEVISTTIRPRAEDYFNLVRTRAKQSFAMKVQRNAENS